MRSIAPQPVGTQQIDLYRPPVLAMRGITKRFPGVTALNNADLDAVPCEVHALVGENAIGKSTLTKILAGVYQPDVEENVVSPSIGANTWIWTSPLTDTALDELAPKIAAWGFDLIELPVEHPGDWDPAHVAAILAEQGLRAGVCAVMGAGRDLTSGDDATVGATRDYLRGCVEAAATVGAAVVGGPIYAPTGRVGLIDAAERRAAIERVAAGLEPVLDEAQAAGVTLALEPLNRYETSLFNTVAQALELIELVAHPALGLLLDTFHLNIEERDLPAAIRAAGPHLVHLHACANDRGAPGADHLDWPSIRDALMSIDYRGAVTIESFTAANRMIATAASIWRPLARSQDAIATDGLRFLRDLFATS